MFVAFLTLVDIIHAFMSKDFGSTIVVKSSHLTKFLIFVPHKPLDRF
jgi:hypothetical protein